MASKKAHTGKRTAQPKLPRIDEIVNNYLDKLFAPIKDRERVPGLAVAVRWNKQIIHLNCYGYANLDTGAKITPNTVFDLGSLSKQFTAAAIYNLVIQKQLDLNDPLSKFFPELPPWAEAITVEDLLHHTSALPEYVAIYEKLRGHRAKGWYNKALKKPDDWYPGMPNRKKNEFTNKDVLYWLGSRKRLSAPDAEYHYSNSGYVVLAELVERVAGQPFTEYVMETVISGIDDVMKKTYVFDEVNRFSPEDPETHYHAKCYNRVKDHFVPVGYTPLNFIVGDGNVHSTISDLAVWEKFHHKLDYNLPARELLWSPVVIKGHKHVNYGAGWRLVREKYSDQIRVGGKLVTRKHEYRAEYHRGEWLGWRSFIGRASKWIVPEGGKSIDARRAESLGIIVLSNADFGDKQFTTCRIAQEISKLYLGKWKKDNIMSKFICDL
jgi:CubicO group peptidase (beta-lactamase class C family)